MADLREVVDKILALAARLQGRDDQNPFDELRDLILRFARLLNDVPELVQRRLTTRTYARAEPALSGATAREQAAWRSGSARLGVARGGVRGTSVATASAQDRRRRSPDPSPMQPGQSAPS